MIDGLKVDYGFLTYLAVPVLTQKCDTILVYL